MSLRRSLLFDILSDRRAVTSAALPQTEKETRMKTLKEALSEQGYIQIAAEENKLQIATADGKVVLHSAHPGVVWRWLRNQKRRGRYA